MKVLVYDTETTDKPPILPGENWNERTSFDNKLLNINDLENENSAWKQMLSKWLGVFTIYFF